MFIFGIIHLKRMLTIMTDTTTPHIYNIVGSARDLNPMKFALVV